ncbi:hypothetical protein ABW19_dt0207539 [Dactylella cylindrospora]|nr:hypothetical protein ABW19_dt0207539 [Dactylella cylindrospora]
MGALEVVLIEFEARGSRRRCWWRWCAAEVEGFCCSRIWGEAPPPPLLPPEPLLPPPPTRSWELQLELTASNSPKAGVAGLDPSLWPSNPQRRLLAPAAPAGLVLLLPGLGALMELVPLVKEECEWLIWLRECA